MIYVFLLEPLFYQALGLATLVMALWALSDAVRRKPAAFDAAGKRTKGFWLGLTGGAAAVGILGTLSPGSLLPFTLAGLVAASVYLADVKPSIGGSGRGSSGPYNRW
ncbi:DUF2516 family protein [Arthrobacter sp. zg-Y820]|uniref:DUF2516 family protein n=1 Tax=unclassified Arthrobacter TaxID=235627 RepID=UPI00254171B0|nr:MULTISPECIES: DUF2516 family protein [unclassified Arthrobacter]MCC9198385.1 DUF2516 family protein [Arthrobacter sp. zg-Y820]MDK1281255.1 DUF2516 family protein [Arthrobacter sp. zg.Y820]WIB09841.1 DUF2516 family protein [Arthrobacter sp. zg-Y820]